MAERIGYMDHISLAVPDVPAQVDFFTEVMGMTAVRHSDEFGLVTDPESGFKIEIAKAEGSETKFLHIGFQVGSVDQAYEQLTEAGLSTVHAPHQRFANRTAFLRDAAGLEIQVSSPAA
ncbi:MAG: VOC family protein [Chloroflexota bacterium]|nr:VOC family protein [Chloroflexota bacterium]